MSKQNAYNYIFTDKRLKNIYIQIHFIYTHFIVHNVEWNNEQRMRIEKGMGIGMD